ncbi:MAG TPA: RbsD/FucU domain-containing protein [Mycetocola sp.]|jgi:L-fucose mutarotase|uniref:RbsD/FucU family protein n=1 Tax=Mycetocola sp. TaxID=1871042 RepID=UPI00262476AA|nr:RbsD/FucU domain-containing protein [Mycetocola sp.]MCU1419925.1 transport protein RbsD/FucU [Mycetocola sp.]MCU1561090.1 transport protein RbsD/FucU [Mycetocola sp.]HEV7849609.1 RbsD/FucU domain-containing protein [Mycetocola sp.]
MLQGIHPLLTGELLMHLDEMGHSDTVIIVDAHFPASRLAERLITLPGTTSPEVLAAVRSVLPLDDSPAVDLMTSADGTVLDVQRELLSAAGVTEDEAQFVDRFGFYDDAEDAYVIIRTGETRKYGCVIVRKGLVGHPSA